MEESKSAYFSESVPRQASLSEIKASVLMCLLGEMIFSNKVSLIVVEITIKNAHPCI